jgi:glycosyltransferase involved in cell wall biosynthesis
LATNIAGIPEMVEHGVNGFLFTPGDLDAFIHHLKILCEETSTRELMGAKSRRLIDDKFESHLIIDKLVNIYTQTNSTFV